MEDDMSEMTKEHVYRVVNKRSDWLKGHGAPCPFLDMFQTERSYANRYKTTYMSNMDKQQRRIKEEYAKRHWRQLWVSLPAFPLIEANNHRES